MEETDAENKAGTPKLDLWGSGRNPASTPVKERDKAHGRDGNEDSRRRGDDRSRHRQGSMLRALRKVECNP
jgi:hypothetical protein